ncbi:MAG: hypothetical protein Kilf2KO_42790 [Rhodospirillales bacterium]
MLNVDQKALFEIKERFTQPDASYAFIYLVDYAGKQNQFLCQIRAKGFLYHAKLVHIESSMYRYAFIPNKNSILWYFRKPVFDESLFDRQDLINCLTSDFGWEEVNDRHDIEVKVRIRDVSTAEKLVTNYLK